MSRIRSNTEDMSIIVTMGILVFIIASMSIYSFMSERNEYNDIRSSYHQPSLFIQSKISKMKNMEVDNNISNNLYENKDHYRRGVGFYSKADFKYYFSENNILYKEMILRSSMLFINEVKFSGKARYTLDGSVLRYSDIEGDKNLFMEEGEPIEFLPGNKIRIFVNNLDDTRIEVELENTP